MLAPQTTLDPLTALKDLLGDTPDMVREGDHVSCRHCGREYDHEDAPKDASECSDDCPGYLARAAIAHAEAR